MKRILYTIPFLLSFVLIWFYLNYLQVNKENELYSYIPYEAEQVFQFNANHVFKKIIFERVFNEDAFLKRIPKADERPNFTSQRTGIDFTHPLTIYKMFEELGPVWVFMLKVNDHKALEKYLSKNEIAYPIAYNTDVLTVAIPYGPTQEDMQQKLQDIVDRKTDSYPYMENLTQSLAKAKRDVTFSISNHVKGNLLNIENIQGELNFNKENVTFESSIRMKEGYKMEKTEKVFVLPKKGIHAHGFFEPKDVINAVIQDMPFIEKLPDTKYFSLNITGFDFQMVSITKGEFYIKPHIELLVKPQSLGEYESFIDNLSKDSIIQHDPKKQIIEIKNRFPIYYDQVGDMLYFSTKGPKKVELLEEEVEEVVYLSMNIREVTKTIKNEISIIPKQIEDVINSLRYYEELTFTIKENKEEESAFIGNGSLTFSSNSEHSIVELVATLQTASNIKIVRNAMSAGQ